VVGVLLIHSGMYFIIANIWSDNVSKVENPLCNYFALKYVYKDEISLENKGTRVA